MVAQMVELAVDLAAHPAPAQRFEVIHNQRRGLVIHSRLGDGQGNRVIRASGQRGGNGGRRVVGGRVQRQVIGLHRFAVGDGAGLVQGQVVELVTALQINAALDQYAFTRRRREAADDGHRRGDHQRTRAGHHQQHQRPVDPVEPQLAHEQWRDHRHGQGQDEHCRGVDFRETVDETLGRRPRALGLLDGVDDAGQGRVIRRGGHLVLQGPGLIDGAGEDFVADGFFHRQAFTGDWRLIDGRATGQHFAVQADTLAGAHPHPRAEPNVFDILLKPDTVSLQHRCRVRRHLHQTADGIARSVKGPGFDQLGHGEQEHHHRRFRPLADQHRAGHGNAHQRVDVQIAVFKGDPAFFVSTEATTENRDQRDNRHHPVRRETGEVDNFCQQCTNTGQCQGPPRLFPGRGHRGFITLVHRLGLHAQGFDGLDDRLGTGQIVGYAEHPINQIELKLLHAGQFA
ncbi:hypothetical protein D3C78_925120 [compost metagenome]